MHKQSLINIKMQNKSKVKNQKLEDDPCLDLKDKLARTLADYDNLVKRSVREREDIYLRATRNFVEDLLPVLDDLERAEVHLQDQGLKMGMDHLRRVLDTHGVSEIPVEQNQEFDSLLHEAIDSTEGEKENTIAQVFSKGYMWKDGKVIKPAKVQVYKGKN